MEDTFRTLAPRLWRALLLYSGSGEVASDAVSEAFAQAMANRQVVREPNAWIWSAAFRIAGGEMARRVYLVEPPDVPMPEGLDRASVVDLIQAVAQLSDLQRRALILRHYLGYSNLEIAQIVGSSPSAIGVHLYRSSRKAPSPSIRGGPTMSNSQLEARFRQVDRVPTPWDGPAAGAKGPTSARPSSQVVSFRGPVRRSRGRRLATAAGVAAALVLGVAVVAPAIGGPGGEAYAVTQNADGTVTVEIGSIEDSDGLEQQLEAAGIPAGVHFVPTGKLCNPRSQADGSTPIDDRWAELEHPRLAISATDGGAFTFTVDRSRLLPGFALLVTMEYAPPQYGQAGATVPSIMAEYTSSDVDRWNSSTARSRAGRRPAPPEPARRRHRRSGAADQRGSLGRRMQRNPMWLVEVSTVSD